MDISASSELGRLTSGDLDSIRRYGGRLDPTRPEGGVIALDGAFIRATSAGWQVVDGSGAVSGTRASLAEALWLADALAMTDPR